MTDLDENTSNESIAWFRRWFDSTYYHKLYSHQTDEEAKNFIENLIDDLQPAIGSTMIDVGCGTGRHGKYLAARGFQVTGIDLAFSNIKEAKKSENASLRFYRHDMRTPFGKENFDYVFNFFASFGYFKNESEHTRVVGNMCEALRPGGVLVLDYINHVYAEKNLVAYERREIDAIVYNTTRWADKGHIFKRITIDDQDMPGNLEHTEKIARFDLRHFDEMLLANGLQIKEVYGDYNLSIFEEHDSPRLILVAGKPSNFQRVC
ncbi:MAG TPA: class I SAM-dependent methyltransferase [Flavitalea sp.]|nr:class I SAM-dependent methyltransferase [Flavitalea sp.]